MNDLYALLSSWKSFSDTFMSESPKKTQFPPTSYREGNNETKSTITKIIITHNVMKVIRETPMELEFEGY